MMERTIVLVVASVLAGGSRVPATAQDPPPRPAAPAAESCGEAPSIAGTAWSLLDQGNLVVTFHFEADGTFIYRNVITDTRSGWAQTGECIRFSDGSFAYEGRMLGDEMEGTSRPEDGPDSRPETWRARLQGPRPASWGKPTQARRAFERGGPESLVRTGRTYYARVEEGEIRSFSLTTGSDGRLAGAGAARNQKTIKLYEVSLFLDEAGARQALAKWKAKDLQKQIGRAEIHEAVLAGAFDKLLVLRFTRERDAKQMRRDFAESLGARMALSEPGTDEFMSCIGRDFATGDQVLLRVRGEALDVEVAGAACAHITNPAVTRGVLGIWIGSGALSGKPDGLLAAAAPLMKQ